MKLIFITTLMVLFSVTACKQQKKKATPVAASNQSNLKKADGTACPADSAGSDFSGLYAEGGPKIDPRTLISSDPMYMNISYKGSSHRDLYISWHDNDVENVDRTLKSDYGSYRICPQGSDQCFVQGTANSLTQQYETVETMPGSIPGGILEIRVSLCMNDSHKIEGSKSCGPEKIKRYQHEANPQSDAVGEILASMRKVKQNQIGVADDLIKAAGEYAREHPKSLNLADDTGEGASSLQVIAHNITEKPQVMRCVLSDKKCEDQAVKAVQQVQKDSQSSGLSLADATACGKPLPIPNSPKTEGSTSGIGTGGSTALPRNEPSAASPGSILPSIPGASNTDLAATAGSITTGGTSTPATPASTASTSTTGATGGTTSTQPLLSPNPDDLNPLIFSGGSTTGSENAGNGNGAQASNGELQKAELGIMTSLKLTFFKGGVNFLTPSTRKLGSAMVFTGNFKPNKSDDDDTTINYQYVLGLTAFTGNQLQFHTYSNSCVTVKKKSASGSTLEEPFDVIHDNCKDLSEVEGLKTQLFNLTAIIDQKGGIKISQGDLCLFKTSSGGSTVVKAKTCPDTEEGTVFPEDVRFEIGKDSKVILSSLNLASEIKIAAFDPARRVDTRDIFESKDNAKGEAKQDYSKKLFMMRLNETKNGFKFDLSYDPTRRDDDEITKQDAEAGYFSQNLKYLFKVKIAKNAESNTFRLQNLSFNTCVGVSGDALKAVECSSDENAADQSIAPREHQDDVSGQTFWTLGLAGKCLAHKVESAASSSTSTGTIGLADCPSGHGTEGEAIDPGFKFAFVLKGGPAIDRMENDAEKELKAYKKAFDVKNTNFMIMVITGGVALASGLTFFIEGLQTSYKGTSGTIISEPGRLSKGGAARGALFATFVATSILAGVFGSMWVEDFKKHDEVKSGDKEQAENYYNKGLGLAEVIPLEDQRMKQALNTAAQRGAALKGEYEQIEAKFKAAIGEE